MTATGGRPRPTNGLDRAPARSPLASIALAGAVSTGASLFAVLYRNTAFFVLDRLAGTHDVVSIATRHRAVAWCTVAASILLGVLAATWAARRWPRRSGIEALAAAARGERRHISARASTTRAASIWVTILGLAPIGREASIVEFGGALGSASARRVGGHGATMAATGMAAAFAAAYHAPFSAVVYLHEHLGVLRSRRARVFCPAGALVGWAATRIVLREHSLFPSVDGSVRDLAIAAAVAVGPAVVVGVMMRSARRVTPHVARSTLTRVGAACTAAALVAAVPMAAGNGGDAFRRIATGTGISVGVLVVLAAAKAVGCLLAIGSGAPGGLITPTLTVGGAASAACAMALHDHGIAGSASVWTVAAIGAAFALAIVVEIPLTAGLLVAELTGSTIVACVAGGCIVIGLLAGRTARQVPFRRRAPRIRDEDA